MPTDFFPTDLMDQSGEFIDSEATRLSHDNRVEFLKGYLRNENLANLVVALDEAVDHLDADFNRDKMFFLKQAHTADLIWLATEVKGIVAAWGDDDFHSGVTKQRLQTLASTLDKRIAEVAE